MIASIPEVAGVFSQGRTRAEACANVTAALRLMLSPEPGEANDGRERETAASDDRCMKRRELRAAALLRDVKPRLASDRQRTVAEEMARRFEERATAHLRPSSS